MDENFGMDSAPDNQLTRRIKLMCQLRNELVDLVGMLEEILFTLNSSDRQHAKELSDELFHKLRLLDQVGDSQVQSADSEIKESIDSLDAPGDVGSEPKY